MEAERLRYEAQRAERRYRAVDPDNRLVARGLEADWEQCLRNLSKAETELASRLEKRPRLLSVADRETLRSLGADLEQVWSAPTATDLDRKELLRAVLEEVNIKVERHASTAHLILRWKGGALTELDIELKGRHQPKLRTDENTIDLVRRLAALYPDALIAGILNRQDRRTATGEEFTVNRVGNLRRHWKIPIFDRTSAPANKDGDLATIEKTADFLGIAPSTVHRWLAEGFITGEQLTPGAPWRIRLTAELKSRFVHSEVAGFVPMINATALLGVTRQTIMQRIKRGELEAVHLVRGKRKGLRIKVTHSTTEQKQLTVFSNQLDSTGKIVKNILLE